MVSSFRSGSVYLQKGNLIFHLISLSGNPLGISHNPGRALPLHDLLVQLIHELKIIRAQRTGDPLLGICPMSSLFTIYLYPDSVRVRIIYCLADSKRIHPRNDGHVYFPATVHHMPERIGIAEPGDPVVHGDGVG